MSDNSETQPTEEQYERQPNNSPIPETTRRNAAKFLLGLSGTVAIGTYAVDYIQGAFSGGEKPPSGDIYTQGTHLVDENGKKFTVDSLPQDGSKEATAFPEQKGGGALVEKKAATLLIRFKESDYKAPTVKKDLVKGYSAYSKVCTHEGCLVSARQGKDFHCPCHQSTYDPRQGAKVVGGPAPRALPQLPIGITKSGNILMATGNFNGPIGPS